MFNCNLNDDYGNAHVYDCDVIHAEDKVKLSQSYFVRSRYNLDEGVRISISQVGNDWDKTTINWGNSKTLKSSKISSFKPNDNLMEVDLTDFVKENAGKIVSLKFENNLRSWAGFKDSNACSPMLMIW